MVRRTFWIDKLESAWKRHTIVWLSGVRRAGKTMLCQSLENVEYFDCELPRTRRFLEEDPEAFLRDARGKRIVLDEIHRLREPSQLLKIAADHFPRVRILATGSSTLGASEKFKDTLTGRKSEVWLTPMISVDLADFGNPDLRHRLLHGGLPPFFLDADISETEFQQWMDDYWAKDILELFRLERRYSFLKFAELLMMRSGGIFEATRFAKECEASRTTIANYLSVLEATFVAHVLRPFSSHRPSEIVAAPKVYAFDTGFVCYYKGWSALRPDDLGVLWEHHVLNELHAALQSRSLIHYWRNKTGHEIDLVITKRGRAPIAVELQWSDADFDPVNLRSFRNQYPSGRNFAVCNNVSRAYKKNFGEIEVTFVSPQHLIEQVLRAQVRSN